MPSRSRVRRSMPPSAHRVFQGLRYDVYQWRQKMFDGSFETFEKLAREDTADIFPITSGKKILVLRQSQPDLAPFWSLPGGVIDRNELPRTGARRELLEETGYTARSLELWETFRPLARVDWTVHSYIARECLKAQPQHLDVGERIRVHEMTWSEFLKIAARPDFRNIHIALHVLRAARDPKKLGALRRHLLGA